MKIKNKTLRNGLIYGAIFGLIAGVFEQFLMFITYIFYIPTVLASNIFYKIRDILILSETTINISKLVDYRMVIIIPLQIIFYALAGLGIAYLVVLYREKVKK